MSLISILAGLAVLVASLAGVTNVSAAPTAPTAQPENGSVEVKFTPLPDNGNGWFCLPPFLGMQSSVGITPTTFTLKVTVETRLCNQVNAVAAIYGMPGNGEAWPQQLKTTTPVSIREPGITEIIFTRGCAPEQYDVIVGATPQTISPLGPWHGPLLFPFDVNTSLQSWGCGPPPSTTSTTTSSTTTTTIDDNCTEYTPKDVSASPSTVAPGGTVTVSGTGTPGTLIQVILRPGTEGDAAVRVVDPRTELAAARQAEPAAAANFAALSNPALVGPDGKWSTDLIVPADAASGDWVVAAYAVGCDTETTTEIDVTPETTTPSTAPSTAPPAVAGEEQVATPVAVGNSSGTQGPGSSVSNSGTSNNGASGLAFTGTSAHLPMVLGIALVTLGGLLLLRSRRKGVPAA